MEKIQKINIDIETFSDEDLNDVGVYKYVESPQFRIDLFAYSINGGPVQQIDLTAGEKIPQEILDALSDETVEKHAFNASFERICLSRFLGLPTGKYLNPRGWHCSRVLAGAAALPLSLRDCGAALDIPHKKLEEGHDLVLFFSKPCKPTKARPDETYHKPEDYPEKWAQYKAYNIRDVEAEMEVAEYIGFTLSDAEYENFILDQKINDRGVLIDAELCQAAVNADARYMADLLENMKALTGLDNPRSVAQFKPWLEDQLRMAGFSDKDIAKMLPDVTKKTIDDLAEREDLPDGLKKILNMKKTLGKTSTKKYTRMIECRCADGRARGLFQFNGAARTGRFAGRLIQLQNLTKNDENTPNILEIKDVLKKEGYDGLCRYGDVSDLLSQLVRTAIIPAPGKVFVDADFAAIEARVLAWLANEQWRLDAFARGEDIYCASASAIFGVPVVKNGENGHLRKKGKVAELACGYGGAVGAMKAFGADKAGWSDEEIKKIVADWRAASPNIVAYWNTVDKAIKERLYFGETDAAVLQRERTAIIDKARLEAQRKAPGNEKLAQEMVNCALMEFDEKVQKAITGEQKRAKLEVIPGAGNCVTKIGLITKPLKNYKKCAAVGNEILIQLPSKRQLLYPNSVGRTVTVTTKDGHSFETDGVVYNTVDSKNKWGTVESYGPKFVENITQATARDLLINAMMNLDKANYDVILHVHDEAVVEVDEREAFKALDHVCKLMGITPEWAQGLIVRADGYLCPCFLKEGFDDSKFLKELEAKQDPDYNEVSHEVKGLDDPEEDRDVL